VSSINSGIYYISSYKFIDGNHSGSLGSSASSPAFFSSYFFGIIWYSRSLPSARLGDVNYHSKITEILIHIRSNAFTYSCARRNNGRLERILVSKQYIEIEEHNVFIDELGFN